MAALVPAGLAAAGSIIGGITGGKGAKKQAKAIAKSTADQIAFARENRDYQYGVNEPQINYGRAADDRLAGLYNIGGDPAASAAAFEAWKASTGYDTTRREALDAVNQRAFAGGAGQSGAALTALQDRAGQVADRGFGSYTDGVRAISSTGANARGLVAGVGNNATMQLINASQNGANGQVAAIGANTANTQNTLQNLINAGQFAYGSSYGGGAKGAAPAGDWWNPFSRGY